MSKKKETSSADTFKTLMPNNIPTSVLDRLSKRTDLADELMKKSADRVNEFKRVNIVVIGKTGVGKSTLINNLFREKLAETGTGKPVRSEEQTSELQSRFDLVCRLLLEKKKRR